LGFAVGPDLGAEFQRAEEAILEDMLAPNQTITAGYHASVIELSDGQSHTGILASESATSLTLRQPAGVEQVLLRKDVVRVTTLAVSLMPEALKDNLTPPEAADVIAWLRGQNGPLDRLGAGAPARTASRVVLFDDESDFAAKLNEGDGTAAIAAEGAFVGQRCLAVTPLQRHSPRIAGWAYPIVEKPNQGQFRYLRLAWKTRGGDGIMIELAAEGRWPEAQKEERRYYAGTNTTKWAARALSSLAPAQWRVVTMDLWNDNGNFTLTGLAPTAMGGTAFFDDIQLLRTLDGLETK
jgi:putative heme-binding domain-containing protein